jgi:hypothetical protein
MEAKRRRVPNRETVTTERVGLVVFLLMESPGVKFTTAKLARRVQMQYGGMDKMLCKLSRVLPLCRDSDGWYILPHVPY